MNYSKVDMLGSCSKTYRRIEQPWFGKVTEGPFCISLSDRLCLLSGRLCLLSGSLCLLSRTIFKAATVKKKKNLCEQVAKVAQLWGPKFQMIVFFYFSYLQGCHIYSTIPKRAYRLYLRFLLESQE